MYNNHHLYCLDQKFIHIYWFTEKVTTDFLSRRDKTEENRYVRILIIKVKFNQLLLLM